SSQKAQVEKSRTTLEASLSISTRPVWVFSTLAQSQPFLPTAPAAVNSEPRRYLTVTDVVNNPALAAAPRAQLTDAAIDY
ncbi:hypothetical protein NL507_31500, partial [Klebsiella pneumoniae]|nr:hypothetical protein [Klebsiella pneumoniae]